jgi:TctA family transporter
VVASTDENIYPRLQVLAVCGVLALMARIEPSYSLTAPSSLAVLGIDADMGRLRTATDYSTVPAGVLYCMRVIAAEALLPSALKDEQKDAERDEFMRKRRDFLADGSCNAASTVLSMLAYGKSIGKMSGVSGNTSWSADGRTLYLYGRPIVVSKFWAIM